MDNPIEDDIIAMRPNGELPAHVPSDGYGPLEVPCVDSLTPEELSGYVAMTARFAMVPNVARLPEALMRLGFYYLGLRVYRFDGRTYERVPEDAATAEFNCLLSDVLERCEGRDLSLTRRQKADIIDNWKGLRGFEADADGRIIRCDAPASFRSDGRYRGALIPFLNGLYNVRLRRLVPFTPYLFIDRCVQADLDPSDHEDCERVYRGILPDDETRRLFYLAAGYTLYSPCSDLGVAFILLGDAETGKSAMTESIQALLGAGSYSKASASSLSLQFGKSRLIGKLANFSDESKTAKGAHVDVEVLKELITGEEADTDIKFGSAVTFRITSKLWFASNEMPDFGGVDPGLLRRMRVFPCDVKQDTDARIKDVMRSPRGLSWLAWKALDEYERFLFGPSRRFGESALMSDRKRALTLQDTLYEYLMEAFDTVETRAVRDALIGMNSRDFYLDYDAFTRESGRQPYSRAKVLSKLSSNYRIGTKRSRRVPRDAFGGIMTGAPARHAMVFADADEVAEINERRRERERERRIEERVRAEMLRRPDEDEDGDGKEGGERGRPPSTSRARGSAGSSSSGEPPTREPRSAGDASATAGRSASSRRSTSCTAGRGPADATAGSGPARPPSAPGWGGRGIKRLHTLYKSPCRSERMELYRVFDRRTRSITTDRQSYGGQVFDSNSTRMHFSLRDGEDEWDFEAEGYTPFIVFNVYDDRGDPFVYGPDSSPAFDGACLSIPYEITSRARSLRVEYILWFVKADVADRFDGSAEGLLVTEYLCSAVDGIAFRASCIKPPGPGCGCRDMPVAPTTQPGVIGTLEFFRSNAIVRPIERTAHINDFGEAQGLDLWFRSLSGEFQQMWLNVPTLSDEGELTVGQLPFGNGYGRIPMLASSVGRDQALVFSPEAKGFVGKKVGASLEYVEREEETGRRHIIRLLDVGGEAIGEVDLPIEDLVQSSRWDDEAKELVLVFGTGREARIPMRDLVDVYSGVAGEIAIEKVSTTSSGSTETRYTIGIDSAYTASIASGFAQASSSTADVRNALTAHEGDLQNPHRVTKAQVGLGNADNTSDIDKPVSTAQKAYTDAVRAAADAYRSELAGYDRAQDSRMDGIRSDLAALTEREDKRHQDVVLSLDARYTKADADRLLQGKMDLVKWGDNISMAADRTVDVDLSAVQVATDDSLNTSSRNPVQNQAVAKALGSKQDRLVQGDNIVMRTNADGTVRISSTVSPMTVDNALDYTSENPVQNKVVCRALDMKADIGEGVGVWKGRTQGGAYLYQRGDVVVYEDALYISKADNNDHHPDDESCWAVVRGGAVTQVVGITPATYIGLIGNDTDTEYEVRHKLGSRNLVFSFMTNDSNHEFVQARAWAPTMDAMRVRFTSPPGTNRIVVNIIKARSVNPSASQEFPLVVGVDTPAKTWSYANETGCPLYAKAYDETGNDMEGDIIQNSPTDFDPVTITFSKEQKGSLVLAGTTSDNVYEVELDGESPYVITGLTNDKGYLIQAFADGTGQSRLDILQEPGKVTIDASVPWKGFVALYPATGMKKFTTADLKSVTHDGAPSYELTYQHNKGRAVGAQIYTSEGLGIIDMHAEANTVKAYASIPIEGALYII